MRDSKPARIVLSLTIVGAASFLLLYFHPFPPWPPAPLHEAIGQVMAEQALELLGPDGRVLVISRESREFERPAAELQRRACIRALEQAGHSPSVTRLIKIDPDRLVMVPPGDFFELLRKTSENDVIISLMGPPLLSESQTARLGRKHGRVVAVCTGPVPAMVDLKRLFDAGLLQGAVADRQGAVIGAREALSGKEWFDRLYQVVTATNLADLPAGGNSRP